MNNNFFNDKIEGKADREVFSMLTKSLGQTNLSKSRANLVKNFRCSPAMTFNCRIQVLASTQESVNLWSFMSCDTPYADVKFGSGTDSMYLVKPSVEDPANVQITYWDLYDWSLTQKLLELYASQFTSEDNLLKEDYASSDVIVTFANFKRSYHGVAFNKPTPSQASSSPNLLSFNWSFAYSSYEEEFTRNVLVLPEVNYEGYNAPPKPSIDKNATFGNINGPILS